MPSLNLCQKKWLQRFLAKHAEYKLQRIRSGLGGDRLLLLEATEYLPLPLIPEYANAYRGYHLHTLEVQLRKFGDPRKTATHSLITVYPHCHLDKPNATFDIRVGQLALPIQAAVLPVKPASNPVVVTWKPKQPKQPKRAIQLSLPLLGLEAKVFQLRQQNRPHLPPVSSQELLAEQIQTWSQRDRREVELPQVLIDLLLAQTATNEEWQSAIDLYEATGLAGAIKFVEGIPAIRALKGIPISYVAASQSVQPRSTTVTKYQQVTLR